MVSAWIQSLGLIIQYFYFSIGIPSAIKNEPILIRERENQLEGRKLLYQWQLFSEQKLPSGLNKNVLELPLDEQFGRVKTLDFTKDALEGFGLTKLAAMDTTLNSLHDYADLAKYIQEGILPLERTGLWTSDVEFGWQMLNGTNPVIIKKCKKLPDNFHVTSELAQPLLTRGKTLEQEMEV